LPLASIVEKYINYGKLQLGGNPKNRLYIRVFIVEKYPKKIESLRQNLPEVLHRGTGYYVQR
jgi:hypothetical protein